MQYRFDSQQTFTRAFKKQFAQTPALYRRAEDWHSLGICPPIRLGSYTLPQAEFITLPEQHLVGLTQSYSCTLEQISTFRTELRSHFWHQYLGGADKLPPVLYGLHHSRPNQEKDDEQEIFYTTAIEPQHTPANVQEGQPVILQGGEYVKFVYEEYSRRVTELYSDTVWHLPTTARADSPERIRYRTFLPARATKRSAACGIALRISDSYSPLAL